jgi:DNA mismatch endonuclease, patch repair protein
MSTARRRSNALAEGAPTLIRDPDTSARLGRVRQKDTSAECAVRSLLHRLGFRFRLGGHGLPGSPDIANQRRKWAVLVHGCFWHAHRACRRASTPKRNRDFWTRKFAANRARDQRVVRELRRAGFRVAIVWECEIVEKPKMVARRLSRLLG